MQSVNRFHFNMMVKIIIGFFIAICILFVTRYWFTHNLSYKNFAEEHGDYIILNESKYEMCSLSQNTEYTISNILICKTDTGLKIYMIEEYPNYEYIAVYSVCDGNIYHKIHE